MQPEYQTVMDFSTIAPAILAQAIHAAIAAVEVTLALWLLVSGGWGLRSSDRAGPGSRGSAAVRLVLGILLLLPLLTGSSWLVPLASCIGTLGLLIVVERQPGVGLGRSPRRWARRLTLAATGLVTLFLVWEQADSARLARDILANADRWEDEEVEWQESNDVKSPKVGDPAPDFELQDVEGNTTIKLSTFRGVRPVALIFGSYT